MKYLNGVTIDGVHYKSSISHNLNKFLSKNNNNEEEDEDHTCSHSLSSMLDSSRDREHYWGWSGCNDESLWLFDDNNNTSTNHCEYGLNMLLSPMTQAALMNNNNNNNNNCLASSFHLPSRTISPPLPMPVSNTNATKNNNNNNNNNYQGNNSNTNSSQQIMLYKFPPCSFTHNGWNCRGTTTCQARSLPTPIMDRRHLIYVGSNSSSHDASHLLLPYYHNNHPHTHHPQESSISSHSSNWCSYPIPHPNPYYHHNIYNNAHNNCIMPAIAYSGYQPTHSNVSHASSSTTHHHPYHPLPNQFLSVKKMNKATSPDNDSDSTVSTIVLHLSSREDNNNNNNNNINNNNNNSNNNNNIDPNQADTKKFKGNQDKNSFHS